MITSSKVVEMQDALEHVVSAAHYTGQVLQGDIGAATALVSTLRASEASEKAQYMELLKSRDALEEACLLASQDIESLEVEFAKLNVGEGDLKLEELRESQAHAQAIMPLQHDHDALDAAHHAALAELARIKLSAL